MRLTVPTATARTACAGSILGFVRAADAMSEVELLGASRCHGWTRMEVVVHIIAGWEEMLGGLVSSVDALVDQPLPGAWTDLEATLIGTGREPVPEDGRAIRERMPALG